MKVVREVIVLDRHTVLDISDAELRTAALSVVESSRRILRAFADADSMNSPHPQTGEVSGGKPSSKAPGYQRCPSLAKRMCQVAEDVEKLAEKAEKRWKNANMREVSQETVTSVGGVRIEVVDGKPVARRKVSEGVIERHLTEKLRQEA